MKQQKLHMIGNAHIDPVWLWQWQEGFHEVKATFRSTLNLMKEFEHFIFISSSAVYYEWIEQSDPTMFEEIRQRVAEGRWQIVGGWWIQPDCNLPGGESFVRQGLYGQHYFKSRFGTIARTGYNVDSFGHNGMLPQILKKSGMDNYVFMRPSPHEKGLPGRLFWWESDDGSRVLTFRIIYEYSSWGPGLEKHIHRCAAELKEPFNEFMCFYGVGNHGGGPTRGNLELIRALNEDPDLPELEMSAPDTFFDHARRQSHLLIPVVHDDLQHHASGCYSAHSGVKRWNRQAENLLLSAEKLCSLANCLTGMRYPAQLDHAWKNVLFNQFHDILAGSSIEAAYDDAWALYSEAIAIASRAQNQAIQAMAWSVDIPHEEGARPILVFNQHAWPVKTNVEVEVAGLQENEALLDSQGNEVALQQVQSWATAMGRNRLSFTAELPALGHQVYKVARRAAAGRDVSARAGEGLKASDTSLENARFRLEFDPKTGCISSLRDKRYNIEVLAGQAARPVVLDDRSDTWSHNVFKYDRLAGPMVARSLRLVENGPVKATVRVVSEFGASRLTQNFSLYRDLDQIDVRVTVDWREQFKVLKLRFPLHLANMRCTYEIPYGHIERAGNGEEEPGQSWVDLSGISRESGELYGLSIINDAKFSYDVNIRDIGLTVLRSPIYAHHMPVEPSEDIDYVFMDQGIQHFNYIILPHAGGWESAGTVRKAAELNQRPVTLLGTYHEGSLPPRDSYAGVDKDNILISVLKKAEDNDDLIVRAYETAQVETEATLRLSAWNREFKARFGPCEIKTFRVPADDSLPVVETNLLEWTE